MHQTLRRFLELNAGFSLLVGGLLASAPDAVGRWLAVDVPVVLRVIGLVLLGHTAILVWASRQDAIEMWGKLNLATIAPYPALTIGLVVAGVIERPLGQGLVLLDGAVVGAIALGHWFGLRGNIGGTVAAA